MELTQQITGGHYSFPDTFWKEISSEAKDLITKMLTVAPEKRITLEASIRFVALKLWCLKMYSLANITTRYSPIFRLQWVLLCGV